MYTLKCKSCGNPDLEKKHDFCWVCKTPRNKFKYFWQRISVQMMVEFRCSDGFFKFIGSWNDKSNHNSLLWSHIYLRIFGFGGGVGIFISKDVLKNDI